MYYDKILGKFVVDSIDMLLIGFILGEGIAYFTRKYLEEQNCMNRLEKDLKMQCKKAKLEKELSTLKKKRTKTRRVLKKIHSLRGGWVPDKLTAKRQRILLLLSQKIRELTELLANYLIKNDSNVLLKVTNSYLNYLLTKSNIYIFYVFDNQEQKILTLSGGLVSGFVKNWLHAGSLIGISVIPILLLLSKGGVEQLVYNNHYQKLKDGLYLILNKSKLPYKLESTYVKPPKFTNKMQYIIDIANTEHLTSEYPLPILQESSDLTLKQILQAKLENELGIIPNPDSNQIKQILYERYKKNTLKKGKKIMFYRNFIKHLKDENCDNITENSIKQFYKIKIRD